MTQDLVVLVGGQKPEVFHSLAAMLRAEGYLVRATVGTLPAIETLYSDPPRLILVPSMSGGDHGVRTVPAPQAAPRNPSHPAAIRNRRRVGTSRRRSGLGLPT